MTIAYEQLLDRQLGWALQEGSMHFEEKSAVHLTLRKIAEKQELIRVLQLPAEFAEQLHSFVREKFGELWGAVQGG